MKYLKLFESFLDDYKKKTVDRFKGEVIFDLIDETKRSKYYKISLSHNLKKEISNIIKISDKELDMLIDEMDEIFITENKVHFMYGIDKKLRGIGLGYHIYKEFMKFTGWFIGTIHGTDDSKKTYGKLVMDDEILSISTIDEILLISTYYEGDLLQICKDFISRLYEDNKKLYDKGIEVSDNLVEKLPNINQVIKDICGYKDKPAKPLVTGADLIKRGWKPGPEMGKKIKELHKIQLEKGLSKEELLNLL